MTDGDRTLATRVTPMERGHQEALAPLVAEAMAEAGIGFDRLERAAVTVGPGSFTGLRVGLAFAKGLALALDVPCIGVVALEALAEGEPGFTASVIDARQDQVYLQCFLDGAALSAPARLSATEAAARMAELWTGGPARVVGTATAAFEGALAGATLIPKVWCDPVALGRLAAGRAPAGSPAPLYLRAPDARTIAERQAAAR